MTERDPEIATTVDSDIVRHATAPKPERLLSIDVLRGLTIAFMIIVNDQVGSGAFGPLKHASWNGFTPTDLVFPTFLLLVGLSTVLSTAARLSLGARRSELLLHTLRRALVLAVLGLLVNNFPLFHAATARFYGVLPRIAICYAVVGTLYLLSPGWKDKVVLAVLCLAGYWALMRFMPVPGFGVPTHDVAINDKVGNIAAWVDRQVFSAPHLYERTRDPEGLVSTIPAVATALFGMLAGIWLRTAQSTKRKAAMLAVAGAAMVLLGLAWDPFFPINKKLWTSSFALFAGGWSLLLMAASVYLVDILRLGRGLLGGPRSAEPAHPIAYQPLLVLGTNAILAYLVSELGDAVIRSIHPAPGVNLKQKAFAILSTIVPHPGWASLLYSLLFLLLCWLIVLAFYRKRIFLRI